MSDNTWRNTEDLTGGLYGKIRLQERQYGFHCIAKEELREGVAPRKLAEIIIRKPSSKYPIKVRLGDWREQGRDLLLYVSDYDNGRKLHSVTIVSQALVTNSREDNAPGLYFVWHGFCHELIEYLCTSDIDYASDALRALVMYPPDQYLENKEGLMTRTTKHLFLMWVYKEEFPEFYQSLLKKKENDRFNSTIGLLADVIELEEMLLISR